MAWQDVWEQWGLIEADLHSEYGIDVEEPGLLKARTFRWLVARIRGLLSADTRLARHFAPDDDKQGVSGGAETG
ncbi:hypothetical protein E1298_15185 [Actinomadura rubrisoli]|uniref:Uncharacterized protein n=1 Tax=Actinomadura rubrisoli TaxID=2530368 RepID=A0A4V2YX78_9ACTN|nr:hypothetical protein E1298_15185 [Actinomadura rubrisoli]